MCNLGGVPDFEDAMSPIRANMDKFLKTLKASIQIVDVLDDPYFDSATALSSFLLGWTAWH